MEKIEKQRLEQLVRLGIIPSNKLPILIQGLDSLSMGKQLLPNEREVISKYMDNLTSIMLNDTNVFNQAKLRTQKLKYQAEEITVNNGVKIFDNPEEEEQQRKQTERKLKVRASDKKERFKLLPAAVKREKRKAGVYEDILSINDTYQAVFEAALELYGVTNIRDLPEDKKAEFFIVVDSASSDNDSSDIEEDMKVKQAVGIASDKRYTKGNMSGAVNAIEKLKPGLSDHPQVKAVLKRQNEEVETDIEQLDELKTGTLLRYATKAGKDGLSKGIAAARASDMDDSEAAALLRQKRDKRYAGQNQAVRKISDRKMKMDGSVRVNEESDIEQLDEDEVGYQHRYAVKNGKAVKDNPKMSGDKEQPYHVYADSPEHAVRKHAMKKEEVELDENEDLANARKMYHKHFVAAMKAMPSSIVQKRHQDEMKKYKKIMGNSFIDQVAPSKFSKFDKKIKEEVELDEGRPSQRHPLEGHAYHEKSNAELVGIAKDAHAAAEAMKSHNTTAENKYRDQANDSATVRHFRKTSGTPDWYKKKYGLKEEAVSKSEVEHHHDEWMNSEHAPYHHDAGNDNKVHKKALSYLSTTNVPKEKHEKLAMHIANKFHGSDIDEAYQNEEEVEQIDELSTPTMSSYVKKVGAENKFTKKRVDGLNLALNKIKSNSMKKEEVETVINELIGNQHKIDANKNGKVDAHDFKLLRSKKKQPQGADFAAQRRKERLASNGRMDEKKQDITQQMADKAKKDNITQSDKEKLSKLATMMKKEETTDSERMDENDDYYGSRDSMSKKEFKRKEMEHELGHEDGRKRKSYYSKPKSYKANTPAVSVKKEEAELTFEEMTPAQKAERLRMITKAADRVQSGAAEKSVKKLAKKDMKSPGAQKGMAPLKKEVDEQIQILRKTIVEGTAREKISAYKELNNLIQEKLKGEE